MEPGRVRVVPGNYEVWQRMQKDAEKQGMQIGGKNSRKDDLWKHGLQKQKKAGAQTPSGDGKSGKKEKEPAASKPQSSPKPAKKRKYPYRKVVDIEDEIFIRETRLEELQKDLMDPKVLRDGERVKATQKEIEEEQEALKKLYEHWEEASELNW